MVSLDQILIFSAAALAVLAAPGPAVLYITTRTLRGGTQAGMMSMLGLAIGDLIQVVAVVAGLAALVAASPLALQALKIAAAGYLLYLAYKYLASPSKPNDESHHGSTTHGSTMAAGGGVFREAVLVNLLNPKSLLFFLAFLPAFIDVSRGPAWIQGLVLGLLFVALGVVTNGTWALFSDFVRTRLLARGGATFLQSYVPAAVFVLLAGMTLLSI